MTNTDNVNYNFHQPYGYHSPTWTQVIVAYFCGDSHGTTHRSLNEIAVDKWVWPKNTQNKVHLNWLVDSAPLKNMKVSWDYYSQYMGK